MPVRKTMPARLLATALALSCLVVNFAKAETAPATETDNVCRALFTESAKSEKVRRDFLKLQDHLEKHVIGQKQLIERILIAVLTNGHLLVEGAPGLAKTRTIRALAKGIDASFQRIQFMPDLMPSDLTGTVYFDPQTRTSEFLKGPIFHNILLADEINRAPSKVQAALLEAMEERQVTVAGQTYSLGNLFMVMATQNPLDQQGTFALPEAQMDRFMFMVKVDYPNLDEERQILDLIHNEIATTADDATLAIPRVSQDEIFAARAEIQKVQIPEDAKTFLLKLVQATRQPAIYAPGSGAEEWLRAGASPRASLALANAARAHAWLGSRNEVAIDDIKAIAKDVLRHRLGLTAVARAEGITGDVVVERILNNIK